MSDKEKSSPEKSRLRLTYPDGSWIETSFEYPSKRTKELREILEEKGNSYSEGESKEENVSDCCRAKIETLVSVPNDIDPMTHTEEISKVFDYCTYCEEPCETVEKAEPECTYTSNCYCPSCRNNNFVELGGHAVGKKTLFEEHCREMNQDDEYEKRVLGKFELDNKIEPLDEHNNYHNNPCPYARRFDTNEIREKLNEVINILNKIRNQHE